MSKPHICDKHDEVMEFSECGRCDGDGDIEVNCPDFDEPDVKKCSWCNGTGISPFPECSSCNDDFFLEDDE